MLSERPNLGVKKICAIFKENIRITKYINQKKNKNSHVPSKLFNSSTFPLIFVYNY